MKGIGKKILTLAGITLFILMSACSSENPSTPPQPTGPLDNPNGHQSLTDLLNAANAMKQSCTSNYTPVFAGLAANAVQNGGNSGFGSILPNLLQNNSGGGCSNDMTLFLLLSKSIMSAGVPYIDTPQGRQYVKSQILGVVNGTWQNVLGQLQGAGVKLTPQLVSSIQGQLLQAALPIALQQAGTLPPAIGGPLAAGIQSGGNVGNLGGGNLNAASANLGSGNLGGGYAGGAGYTGAGGSYTGGGGYTGAASSP